MNYTLADFTFGFNETFTNFSLYTIKAFEVSVFNYTLEATNTPIL